jgi:hypothetical protein
VKSRWVRKLVVPLVLAWIGAQSAPGSALLASALTFGLEANGHAHSVSLVADEGHLHLVLSHDPRGGREQGAEHDGDLAISTAEGEHVLHLTGDDPASSPSRRAGFAPAPAATTLAVVTGPAPRWLLRPSPQPRARGSESLRTVFLRL